MSTSPFELHPRLQADCIHLGNLPVSRALLMDDARFPWCVLVPRFPGLRELHDVPASVRMALMEEIEAVSRALLDGGATKINVGALGNLVPQLHVHVLGRTPEDPAWPGPVWGSGAAVRYRPEDRDAMVRRLTAQLALV